MTVYLLHFDRPLEGGQKPQHYLGFTDKTAEERLADHLAGRNRPARIVVAAVEAGRQVRLARVWPDGTPQQESSLKKKKKGFRHLCPECEGA